MSEIKFGHELKVGDVIGVWWKPGRATISRLEAYRGPLEYLWPSHGGARIASFADRTLEMTIGPEERYEVFNRWLE